MRTHMRTLTGAVVVFVAGLSVVVLAGQKPEPTPPMPAEPMMASVDDISNHPDRFYGKSVRVTEDVARVMGPRVFTLDEESILGMGKDVMVVSPKGVSVREDQQVVVTGVVREFAWTELYATSVRPEKTR
mgnify:CR=1 FL=1